jgi:hypothetical protein
MTWFELYLAFGLPAILLAMAFGAFKLAQHYRRVMDREDIERNQPAE